MALNIKNRTIYCNDNLNILKGINNSCIDLIYLDPPFNSGRNYGNPRKSMAELAQFKDKWDEDDENIEWWFQIKEKHPRLHLFLKDVDDYANKSTQVYLTMMAVRVLEMHRVLKDTGSLYYHCDQSAGHYVKVMLDIIFGMNNFKNEVVWCYDNSGRSTKHFPHKHDNIYSYSKSNKRYFDGKKVAVPMKAGSTSFGGKLETDSDGRKYRLVYGTKNSKGEAKYYKYYLDEGKSPNDWWDDILPVKLSKERSWEWETQKPLALLERIIKSSSKEGDVVLDPFCGCATTCVAAERLGRKWVGIDVWEFAHKLIEKRVKAEFDLWGNENIHKLTKPPTRTDSDPEHKQKRKREYIADEVKEMVWQRDEGKCRNCGATENLQYDHIIPHSKGGSNEITNLQILCRNCNLTKSNRYFS